MEKSTTEILSKTFLFRGTSLLAIEKRTPFFSDCSISSFAADSIIQSAEAPFPGLAVILAGEVAVLSSATETACCLRTVKAGGIFGAATLYTDDRVYGTVVRALSSCDVLQIPENSVKTLIGAHREIAENYIRFLSERICFLNQKITAFTAGGADAKLAVYLANLPADQGGARTLTMSLSSLADSLGMGRASLYRALDKLEEHGIIARSGKTILVPNENALNALFQVSH